MTDETHHTNYVKIWAILCVLLAISIAGPLLEIRIVTLITAFGIAVVKAYIVAKNFMHVNVQPRYVAMLAEGTGGTQPSYALHDAQVEAEAQAGLEHH